MANKAKRLDAIMDILLQNGKVQISDLVQQFHVADMTIRRDFDFLVSQGKILRTHGGAILADSGINMNGWFWSPLTSRVSQNRLHPNKQLQVLHIN